MTRIAVLGAAVSLAWSCAHGRDELSGPDAQRIGASALALDTIADDTVNPDEGDATDWRALDLEHAGALDVQLHWDNERANLSLELFDALGQQLASGELWGQKGRQAKLDVPERGRYYVRVAGMGDRDFTAYSLKALFQRKTTPRCHDCTPGQKTCVAKDAYAVCQQTKEGCNAWVEVLACGPDQSCRDGECGAGCTDQCAPDERRCSGSEATQICVRGPGGCMMWAAPQTCDSGMACDRGRCKKSSEPVKEKAPPRPAAAAAPAEEFVQGRIISMYSKEGRRTLHIEIGENKGVQAGMTGAVLEGSSDKPLENGQLKVVRVTGNYCIAETALEAIGNNRSVRIKLK